MNTNKQFYLEPHPFWSPLESSAYCQPWRGDDWQYRAVIASIRGELLSVCFQNHNNSLSHCCYVMCECDVCVVRSCSAVVRNSVAGISFLGWIIWVIWFHTSFFHFYLLGMSLTAHSLGLFICHVANSVTLLNYFRRFLCTVLQCSKYENCSLLLESPKH